MFERSYLIPEYASLQYNFEIKYDFMKIMK